MAREAPRPIRRPTSPPALAPKSRRGGPRIVETEGGCVIEWVRDGEVVETIKCKSRQEARSMVARVLNPPKKG